MQQEAAVLQCQPVDEENQLDDDDDDDDAAAAAAAAVESDQTQCVQISDLIRSAFSSHAQHLREVRRKRRISLKVKPVVSSEEAVPDVAVGSEQPSHTSNNNFASSEFGEIFSSDEYEGDCVVRTLNRLLAMVDDRGFARSPQQVSFHDAFIRACSRVMYRSDWSMAKPAIMKRNQWKDCPSQILVSTPRRFGKTFSIAIFVAALALSCSLEIVIFSPARRASRKLLERIVEFIRLLDCGDKIVEYNQEQCRLKSFIKGKTSLIRSFPSKVSVRFFGVEPRTRTHPHRNRMQGRTSHRDTYTHTSTTFIQSNTLDRRGKAFASVGDADPADQEAIRNYE